MASALASEIYDDEKIFADHGLTLEEGRALLEVPEFRKMVNEARKEWGSLNNAKERIQVKARVALEEAIIDIFSLLRNTEVPAAARVAAFKELKEIAGVASKEDGPATAVAPSITIVLGHHGETIEVTPGVTHRPAPEDVELIEDFAVDTDIGSPDPEESPDPDVPPELVDGVVFNFSEDLE